MEPHFSAYTQWQSVAQNQHANLTVVDMVTSDMLHLVDAHWHQFPPMNPLWHTLLGFVITILGIL